jgi:hypothetical protein
MVLNLISFCNDDSKIPALCRCVVTCGQLGAGRHKRVKFSPNLNHREFACEFILMNFTPIDYLNENAQWGVGDHGFWALFRLLPCIALLPNYSIVP